MSTYNVMITEDRDSRDALAEGQGDGLVNAFGSLAEDVARDPAPLQAALDAGETLGFLLTEIN